MRAIVFYQHGGPEVLQYREDIPVPQPGRGEVLVAVKYAALNRLDDFVRTGWRGLDLAFPHILGADFSGTIAALGEECDRLAGRPAGGRQPDAMVRQMSAVPRRLAQPLRQLRHPGRTRPRRLRRVRQRPGSQPGRHPGRLSG